MAYLAKCVGLVTFRNELNNFEGSLAKADNVVIDQPDVITPRRGFTDFGQPAGTENTRIKQIFEYKDVILRHFDNIIQYQNETNNFTNLNGSFPEVEVGLRIKTQEANRNLYITTSEGIKKIDAVDRNDIQNAIVQNAGAVKAVDLSARPTFEINGVLPPQSKAAYRVAFGYTDRNNNLILGSPSSRFILTNNSKQINVNEISSIEFDATDAPNDSDYVILNTTQEVYTIYFDVSGSATPPAETDTINTTFIRVLLQGLTLGSQRAAITANVIFQEIPEVEIDVVGSEVTIENKEPGEVSNIAAGVSLTNVTVNNLVEGEIVPGDFANAEITFTLPDGLNTRYFYQIYRTAVFSANQDLSLVDVEPGDDMNLVLEQPITEQDLIDKQITVIESTPESFRQAGVPLYTSPNIGQGILRANERPPLAKDIELFRNSLFFANTSVAHSYQFNLITAGKTLLASTPSVLNLTSDISSITIGNSQNASTYTFVGESEQSEIKVDATSNTAKGSWILLNSANNINRYYLLFDTDGATDIPDFELYPELEGRQLIRINLHLYDDTLIGSQNAVFEALDAIDDFVISKAGTDIVIDNIVNGATEDITLGSIAPGNLWDVDTPIQGRGEDEAQNEVLLSSELSPAIAIDETARSLIRVINKNTNSVVNAYYLSGPDDLPGIIRLEAKTLVDDQFFIGASDSNTGKSFSPELPLVETISIIGFSDGSGSNAKIVANGHGLATGNEIYIVSDQTTPSFKGKFRVTRLNDNEFTIPQTITIQDLTSNAFYFDASSVFSDNLTAVNRLYYSKINQPEAVPIINFIEIGPKDEPIERILSLRDNLIVMKTDGVYLVTGTSEPNFNVRLVDRTALLIAPDSAVVLNNQIYGLTNQGVCTITENGVGIISRVIENKIREVTKPDFNFRSACFGVAYENDRSYILWLPETRLDMVATQAYRYNNFERAWTRWTIPATCGVVNFIPDKLYIGSGTSNFTFEERKNGDRTDYSDRDFIIELPANFAKTGRRFSVASVQNLEVGDVILQKQFITIVKFNNLLKKLDIDVGLDDSDYFASLELKVGDSLTNKLQMLNDKLVVDDSSNTITAFTAAVNFEDLRDQYNTMMEELNNSNSDTAFSNYKQITVEVEYESVINSRNTLLNEITTIFELPILQGDVIIYKNIKSEVQWNPQHFGDPAILKQIREATLIFDQNNFYGGTLSFASDLSQKFVDIDFKMSGVGYFGYASDYVAPKFYFGGNGNDAPFRTIVPRDKQRCRYLTMKMTHNNAREFYNIVGISADVRPVSTRGYR